MGGGYNLEQLGIQCLLNETGYICLGKSYGNACIQFGVASGEQLVTVPLPITYSKILMCLATDANNSTNVNNITAPIISVMRNQIYQNNILKLCSARYSASTSNYTNLGVVYYLAITIP